MNHHCHQSDPWWVGVLTLYVIILIVVCGATAFFRVSPDYDKEKRPLDVGWALGSLFWPVYLIVLWRRYNLSLRRRG